MQRTLDYYETQVGKRPVSSLWLLSGLQSQERLLEIMNESLPVPVNEVDYPNASVPQASQQNGWLMASFSTTSTSETSQEGDSATA